MNVGVVFPQTEFPSDPIAIRDYGQAIEAMGFSHLVAYDHILGANPDRPGGWSGPYTYQSTFQEPLMLFSYLSGVTHELGFLSGIIILPQRQTALFAKQAANLDIYCGGRLRVGIGLGWNEVEFIGLNEDFHDRGKRIEEQVDVLRKLWSQPLVDYKGQFHTIPDAGINPLPIQRPIPIWFGGTAEAALRRIAHLGDGWLPNFRSFEAAKPALDLLENYLRAEGRDWSHFGLEPRLVYGDGNPDVWNDQIDRWQSVGATQFSINTMGCGFRTPEAHLSALEKFARSMGLAARRSG